MDVTHQLVLIHAVFGHHGPTGLPLLLIDSVPMANQRYLLFIMTYLLILRRFIHAHTCYTNAPLYKPSDSLQLILRFYLLVLQTLSLRFLRLVSSVTVHFLLCFLADSLFFLRNGDGTDRQHILLIHLF